MSRSLRQKSKESWNLLTAAARTYARNLPAYSQQCHTHEHQHQLQHQHQHQHQHHHEHQDKHQRQNQHQHQHKHEHLHRQQHQEYQLPQQRQHQQHGLHQLTCNSGVPSASFSTESSSRTRDMDSDEPSPMGQGEHPSLMSLHGLSSHQLEFRELAQAFAAKELLPNAARWDEEKYFPVDTLRMAADLGFAGLFCRDDIGGTGLSRADGAVIFEALSYADVSTTAYLTIHNMNASIIDRFGSEEQRQTWLPPLISMELLSSYCLTEPNSGSDAASLQTTARKAPGSTDFILNGSKAFISGAGVSDVYLVMARSGGPGPSGISCFLIQKGMPGVSFGKPEKKMGWNSQPTAAVILEDVRVPHTHLIGGEGNGFKIAMAGLDGGRINIAACSVGGAQFCVDHALEHVKSRTQFGKRLVDFQNTQFALADAVTAVECSRLMVRNAAAAVDLKVPWATSAAAAAKRHATDSCYEVANKCLQMLGGYGYLKDYPIERYVRDLRVHTILEGTNEIMRLIIARRLLK